MFFIISLFAFALASCGDDSSSTNEEITAATNSPARSPASTSSSGDGENDPTTQSALLPPDELLPPDNLLPLDDEVPTAPPTVPPTAPEVAVDATPTLKLETPLSAIAIATHPRLQSQHPNQSGHIYYFAERQGKIWEHIGSLGSDSSEGSSTQRLHSTQRLLLDISSEVKTGSEYGLLGMTFSPNGQWLYIMYSDSRSGANILQAIKIKESQSTGELTLDPQERKTLLTIPQPYSNHNGGDIKFSPQDGYLYIALGDGGSAGDPGGHGQNPQTLLGSILRIDPKPETGRYEIPLTNPFRDGSPAADKGAAPVWAYGVRNPWRIAFDSNGDLWVADVGQNRIEEITLIRQNSVDLNLGWNEYEGSQAYKNPVSPVPNHLLPIFQYSHSDTLEPFYQRRCSITGGHIYTGSELPKLRGKYLYADYCEWGVIRAYDPITQEGDIFVASIGGDGTNKSSDGIINFGKTAQGETILGALGGTYYLARQ